MVKYFNPGRSFPAVLSTGVLACGLSAGACAAESAPAWKLSGFGTLGAVHSSNRNVDFISSVLKADGAGHTRAWSVDVDSRVGAQLDVATGRWSGVVQVVSEQRLDGSYRPLVEWANIKVQLTPDLALRAGRIALPGFLAAEYRKVGYTLPWVRPPVEVYGALPIGSSDGVDATWRWDAGGLRHATQVFHGQADLDLYNGLRLQASGIAGLAHSVDRGPFSGRVAVLTGNLTTDVGKDLFTALRSFGPRGHALADRHAIRHRRVSMLTAGFTHDPGQWFVSAEAGHSRSTSPLGGTTALHVGAGYRHGALTPYAGYARVHADVPAAEPGLPAAGLPPREAATVLALNAALNGYLSARPAQSTWSAGLRWDAARDIALKAQVDYIRPHGASSGMLVNPQPAFQLDKSTHVTSVALDVVF
ncbi:hypothetical protein [Massilia niastensis]|uniref:hypothetical protein n=1 Tax=Massilia niastensis TaxID=544911 RepID=UPI00036A56C0|nr:hypothetical protein [Massilia niastensis]